MEFVKACNINEINPMKLVTLNNERILLVNLNNKIYAMDEICSHKGAPLNEGSLQGKILTCPWHQSQFDVTTGKVLMGPAMQDVKSYAIKIEGDNVFVEVD